MKLLWLLLLLQPCVWALQPAMKTWPPALADASATWDDTKDSGPLGGWAEKQLQRYFRSKMVEEVGVPDTFDEGFAGIVELAHVLASKQTDVGASSRRVMTTMFPDWPPAPGANGPGLLYWFRILFSERFPGFSAKMVASATRLFAHWLAGPLEVKDLEGVDVGDGRRQLVKVKRCRFLEEAKCASVCVNACMLPTQQFFTEDMGIPCTLTPDYDTLSCEFKFGLKPTIDNDIKAASVACFKACPVNGQYRSSSLEEIISTDDSSDASCPDLILPRRPSQH